MSTLVDGELSGRFLPESLAYSVVVSGQQSADVLLEGFRIEAITDNLGTGERDQKAWVVGTLEFQGEEQRAEIQIHFPGIYERAVAKIRHREPRAVASLSLG